ncbi:MAG: hypothetical protein ACPGVK_04765 [Halocynthiibacter sp.]
MGRNTIYKFGEARQNLPAALPLPALDQFLGILPDTGFCVVVHDEVHGEAIFVNQFWGTWSALDARSSKPARLACFEDRNAQGHARSVEVLMDPSAKKKASPGILSELVLASLSLIEEVNARRLCAA